MPDDSQLPADFLEDVERELELFARVRRGDDRAYARLVARDGRKGDALREHPFSEEAIRQLHRERAFAHDDGCNGTLARAGVQPERLQAGLEEARIVPQ